MDQSEEQLQRLLDLWDESEEEAEARKRARALMLRDKKRKKTRGKDTDAGGDILLYPKEHLVCVCGHLLDAHNTLGNNGAHAHCRTTSGVPCHCVMHARPIIKVSKGALHFQRRARGIEYPHAFTGAINAMKARGEPIEWLVTTCDRCGNEFNKDASGQYAPIVHVLDLNGEIQRKGKDQPIGSILGTRDTGKHIMLCAICDYEDKMLTGYKG